jgi:hypothetical protein
MVDAYFSNISETSVSVNLFRLDLLTGLTKTSVFIRRRLVQQMPYPEVAGTECLSYPEASVLMIALSRGCLLFFFFFWCADHVLFADKDSLGIIATSSKV